MSKFRYLIKEGFRNIWANRLMSIASIGVLFSCLLLIGVALIISINVDAALVEIERQNIIMVFLEDVDDASIKTVKSTIENMNNVESCTFVSKEEALQTQLDSFDTDTRAYFDVLNEDNPMPDGFRVSVTSMKNFEQTVRELKQISGVTSVRGRTDITSILTGLRNGVTIAGTAIIGILFVVSLFIISNTIKITMYSRKLEIGIMKAVGATDKFVRTPFVIEGILLGVISGLVSTGVLYYLYKFAVVYLMENMQNIAFVFVSFDSFALYFLVGSVFLGVLVGIFGSVFSIGRYLKHEGSEFNAF